MNRKKSKEAIARKWESIRKFPGVFAQGSDTEAALMRRRKMGKSETPFIEIHFRSLLTDAGLVSDKWFAPTHYALPNNFGGQLAQYFDFETLLELDRRLRWLRCYLTQKNNPYDRENIVLVDDNEIQIPQLTKGKRAFWLYESEFEGIHIEPAFDPIDFLIRKSPTQSDVWYAAKCLAHNRRAEALEEEFGTNLELAKLGLSREWMLFGETWAEARAVVGFGDDTLRGIRTKKAAALGGEIRRFEKQPSTDKILQEMRQFIENGHPVNNAARLTFERRIGTSTAANRQAWYRHKKKRL